MLGTMSITIKLTLWSFLLTILKIKIIIIKLVIDKRFVINSH